MLTKRLRTLVKINGGAVAIALLGAGCSLLLDLDRPQCDSDRDCQLLGDDFKTAVCEQNYCVPAPAEGDVCSDDEDCAEAEICESGACVPVDASSECSTSDDCKFGQRCEAGACEGSPDPAWACVREAFAGQPEEGELDLLVPIVSVSDFAMPLPGIEGRTCPILDRFCEIPRELVASNSDGLFAVSLPGAFNGYLEVDIDGFDPTLYIFPPRRFAGSPLPAMLIVPVEFGSQILDDLGAVGDPQRGHIFVTVHDCTGTPAGGVLAVAPSADSMTVPYYVAETPLRELKETVAGRGVAGFVNLPIGSAVVNLYLRETGQELGKITAIIRAGQMNQGSFVLPIDP